MNELFVIIVLKHNFCFTSEQQHEVYSGYLTF